MNLRAFSVLLALALVVLGFSALRLRSSNELPDDAFISLRYATHLAQGEGLRFNPGGERVEGFSSPLHVVLLAAGVAAGIPGLPWLHLVSLVTAGLLIVATGRLARATVGSGFAGLCVVALALNPALSTWARGGLETTLFSMVLVTAVMLVHSGRRDASAYAAGLLALIRPEGILYWLPLGLLPWNGLSARGRFLALATVTVAPWWLLRWVYFGALLPNTYYAKMDGVRGAQLQRGLEYVEGWAGRAEYLVPLVVLSAGVAWTLARRERIPLWVQVCLGCLMATVAFAVISGGDHMAMHRFLLPALSPLLLISVWSLERMARLVSSGRQRAGLVLILAGVFLSQPLRVFSHEVRHPRHALDRPLALVEPLDDSHINRFFRLGQRLRQELPADATVAVVPAGALPYASGLSCLDMLGLNDTEIARQNVEAMGTGRMGHEKGSGDIVMRRQPDYVLLRHHPTAPANAPADPEPYDLTYVPVRQLWESPEFHRLYRPRVFEIDPNTAFTLMERK